MGKKGRDPRSSVDPILVAPARTDHHHRCVFIVDRNGLFPVSTAGNHALNLASDYF
jgi:hypothetical protein